MDRDGSPQERPLLQTAPRSALAGSRAIAMRSEVQALTQGATQGATPHTRRQQQQLALTGNQPVAVGALTTGGAAEVLSVRGTSVQFVSVTTAGKRARPMQTPTSKGRREEDSPSPLPLSGQRCSKRSQPVNRALMLVTPGASSAGDHGTDNLVLDLQGLTAAAKEAAEEDCAAAATSNLLQVAGFVVLLFFTNNHHHHDTLDACTKCVNLNDGTMLIGEISRLVD
jgi:hypothetical protein